MVSGASRVHHSAGLRSMIFLQLRMCAKQVFNVCPSRWVWPMRTNVLIDFIDEVL
jgi:hypothetical protein